MVSINNLSSIFNQKALLSKEKLGQLWIYSMSIANEEVQQLRSRVSILDAKTGKYRSLHSYVPFYFAQHTPMLYKQYINDRQQDIVIFEVSRAILTTPGVLFTDGNASNQQLSNLGTQRVEVIPATSNQPLCQRTYKPNNIPSGTNANRSDFYSDITFLNRLNWSIINDRYFNDDNEKVRIKHAEVLVPDSLSLTAIKTISVSTPKARQKVNSLIETHKLQGSIPFAEYKPKAFF